MPLVTRVVPPKVPKKIIGHECFRQRCYISVLPLPLPSPACAQKCMCSANDIPASPRAPYNHNLPGVLFLSDEFESQFFFFCYSYEAFTVSIPNTDVRDVVVVVNEMRAIPRRKHMYFRKRRARSKKGYHRSIRRRAHDSKDTIFVEKNSCTDSF